MPQTDIPDTRLNVSLKGDDSQVLLRLRKAYEKELGHRLSWAEVIRLACRRQDKLEKSK